MNKKILFSIIAGVVLLVGGVVGAFTLIKSPKEAYLYAEYKTANSAIEQLENRFKEELKWKDTVQSSPTKMDIEFSANVDADYGLMDYEILDALNSSSVNLTIQSNPKDSTYAFSAGANILDYAIDPFTAYLTDEKVIGEMPFQDEALEMSIEKLLDFSERELSNVCIQEEDFKRLMEQQGLLTEEDLEYLKDELIPAIYKAIPDEAFKKEDNNLTMELSGNDIENLLDATAKTLENDEVVKRIVNDYINLVGECEFYTAEELIDEITDNLSSIRVDISIKSVLTVKGSQIIERKLYINDEKLLEGTQNFKEGIVFDYEITDTYTSGKIKGEIGTDKKDIEDEIEISVEGETVLLYEGKETHNKKERDFSRAVTFSDGYDDFTFNWDGTQSFAGDGNVSDNEFYFEVPGEGRLSLHMKTDSQKTKGIDLPSNTVDLTDMSHFEMEQYFENEVAEKFMYWAEDLIYELEDLEELFYY